jgi:hypothetical protein
MRGAARKCAEELSAFDMSKFLEVGNICRLTEFHIAAGQPGKIIIKKGVGAVYERRDHSVGSAV